MSHLVLQRQKEKPTLLRHGDPTGGQAPAPERFKRSRHESARRGSLLHAGVPNRRYARSRSSIPLNRRSQAIPRHSALLRKRHVPLCVPDPPMCFSSLTRANVAKYRMYRATERTICVCVRMRAYVDFLRIRGTSGTHPVLSIPNH